MYTKPEQHALAFTLFMKHDDTFISNDAVFITTCINKALSHERKSLDFYEWWELTPKSLGVLASIKDVL